MVATARRIRHAMTIVLAGLANGGGFMEEDVRFTSGSWTVEAVIKIEGMPDTGEVQQITVDLSAERAALPPAIVAFSSFYHAGDPSNVRFSGGKISGYLNQSAVPPFQAHKQAVSGWYGADAFEMVIDLPPLGAPTRQIVRGRLLSDS